MTQYCILEYFDQFQITLFSIPGSYFHGPVYLTPSSNKNESLSNRILTWSQNKYDFLFLKTRPTRLPFLSS